MALRLAFTMMRRVGGRRRRWGALTVGTMVGLGCASGGGDEGEGGNRGTEGAGAGDPASGTTTGGGDASTGGGGAAPDVLVASSCPPGEVGLALDGDGRLVCDRPRGQIQTLLRERASLLFGYRDICGENCSSPPAKWGTVTSTACTDGAGADNNCTTQSVGGNMVEWFGLNVDGDVDNNDRFYLGLHIEASVDDAAPEPGPCAPGAWMVGVETDGRITCSALAPPALERARAQCHVYFGWNDGCSSCTSPPGKWGRTASVGCEHGVGTNGLCLPEETYDGTSYRVYGLNVDGDVDDNDKFYFGLQCDVTDDAPPTTTGICPPGTFVTKVTADGGMTCTPLDALVADAFAESCTLHFGWADVCNGCTSGPTRRGQVRAGQCINGVGVNNICTTAMLGGNTVELFGLTTDGDVDDNDTFFLGLECAVTP
ncbi:MAG: hypothetical protein AAF928_01060 [Myxococcota bacterium]